MGGICNSSGEVKDDTDREEGRTYTQITTNANTNNTIKVCIYAEQIIIEPGNVISPGYLLINDNNIIHQIGKTTSNIKNLYNETNSDCTILECDILCPGLIDIHTHGIGGDENVLWYYKNPQYTSSKLPAFGTTSFLASVTFSDEDMDDVLSMCSNQLNPFINNVNDCNGAICEGIHCEGPIIADYGGLPNSSDCKEWDITQFEQFIDKLNDDNTNHNVKVMTISPSVDHKQQFERMKLLKKKGIIAALGHDKQVNEQQIIDALSLFNDEKDDDSKNDYKYSDIYHMTHIFNVQKFHHRDSGLANFALCPTLPKLEKYENIRKVPTIEVIGDMCHLSPILIQSVLNCHKASDDLDRIIFITDGIAEPVPDKKVFFTTRCIHVEKDGKFCVNKEKNILCGSCCDMITIFKNLINIFNVNIDEAVGMCSTNAAKRLRMDDKIGSLRVGTRADMILMNEELDLLNTIVNGNIVYSKFICPTVK